jgi:putative tricarboxylic transport membrane protein
LANLDGTSDLNSNIQVSVVGLIRWQTPGGLKKKKGNHRGFTEQATLFWGVVVSMWIGNVFLLILNLPLIGLWVRMISVPYHLLYPAILVFCAIGVYSISDTTFDVYLMALFGLLGYGLLKLGCEPTPLLLAFILGPPMEEHLRRALVLSEGRPDVLLREPLSAVLLAIAALLLVSVLLPAVRKKREETFVSEG